MGQIVSKTLSVYDFFICAVCRAPSNFRTTLSCDRGVRFADVCGRVKLLIIIIIIFIYILVDRRLVIIGGFGVSLFIT